jgi:hypothetical protein
MNDLINTLDDATAIRVLRTIAEHQFVPGALEPDLAPDKAAALQQEFGVVAPVGPVTEAEVARQALLVLAQDPDMAGIIRTLATSAPQPTRSFGDPAALIAVATAAVFVLKSKIRFRRDKNGKWSLDFGSDPLDKDLMKTLIEKLFAWKPAVFSGGGETPGSEA